jgi:hypothetical protein
MEPGNTKGSTLSWQGFYESLPDGRSKITASALIALRLRDGLRILDSLLSGGTTKVLLLDKPLQLGEAVKDSDIPEYYLRRIRICELPGWPPIFELMGTEAVFPNPLDCRVTAARFEKGGRSGQEGIELTLDHETGTFKAWHLRCPAPLLRCVEATLKQDGAVGKKLRDLQEMRLIGAE